MSGEAPAGWYPDGSGNERYWDGEAWTEHLRVPAPPSPLSPRAPEIATSTQALAETPERAGMWSKVGSAVKKAAADKRAAKEDAEQEHKSRAAAAGALVTSGEFGEATIEVYEGGFVRIAESLEITKKTPYEKLRSITFIASEAEAAASTGPAPGSPIEGAVMQAMSGIMKGGKVLVKGTAIGLATSGVAQMAANASRKSTLLITTDKSIHTLSNQKNNGLMNVSRKQDDAVARALVEAGNAALGIRVEVGTVAEAVAPAAAPTPAIAGAAPSLSDRLRELSELHHEGILSDDEFAAAKAHLLRAI